MNESMNDEIWINAITGIKNEIDTIKDEQIKAEIRRTNLEKRKIDIEYNLRENVMKRKKIQELEAKEIAVTDKWKNVEAEIKKLNEETWKCSKERKEIRQEKCGLIGHEWTDNLRSSDGGSICKKCDLIKNE